MKTATYFGTTVSMLISVVAYIIVAALALAVAERLDNVLFYAVAVAATVVAIAVAWAWSEIYRFSLVLASEDQAGYAWLDEPGLDDRLVLVLPPDARLPLVVELNMSETISFECDQILWRHSTTLLPAALASHGFWSHSFHFRGTERHRQL